MSEGEKEMAIPSQSQASVERERERGSESASKDDERQQQERRREGEREKRQARLPVKDTFGNFSLLSSHRDSSSSVQLRPPAVTHTHSLSSFAT